MAGPFHPLVNSWKDIPSFPGWGLPDPDDRSMSFAAPLDIGGVTIAHFWLRGRCIEDQPDREVTFQLEVGNAGIRTRAPLIRVDWRPLSGGHGNTKGPPGIIGTTIKGTHFHPFELNWLEDEQRMRTSNLPLAEGITEPLQSFSELLDFIKIRFRINGIERILPPEWVEELLI
jgi:hypothetical protein